jgi:hypothetical protein
MNAKIKQLNTMPDCSRPIRENENKIKNSTTFELK